MRWLQAVYDFWLDLTGVCVGTYRRNVFVLMHTSFGIVVDFVHSMGWFAVGELPFSFLIWWIMTGPRKRARADDADQRAGRYSLVNRRALESLDVYVLTSIVLMFGVFTGLLSLMSWHVNGSAEITQHVAQMACFVLIFFNEGLMVRERDGSRFSLRRPVAAAGAA